jgi:hypothetical protein
MEGTTMSKKHSWVMAILACALAVGWLLATPGVAIAEADFPDGAWNMELVGAGLAGVPLSKLAPWPRTDGNYFYSGGYHQGAPVSWWIIDVKDKYNPVGYEYPVFDPIISKAPPTLHQGRNPWNDDFYNDTNNPENLKSPCTDWQGVDFSDQDAIDAVTPTCWDPGWTTRTHFTGYGTGKIVAVNAQRRRGAPRPGSNRIGYTGVSTWDVHKPKEAKLLDIWFDQRILVILDLHDPENIVEVGKWWVYGQKDGEEADWVDNGSFSNPVLYDEESGKISKRVGLHYVAVKGNIAYLSYHQAGLIILDVTDKTNPVEIGEGLNYIDPEFQANDTLPFAQADHEACLENNGYPEGGVACGNAHSGKLVPGAGGLLAMTDEYFRCPYGHLRLIDVSDPAEPFIISHHLLPPLAGETISRTINCEFQRGDYTQRSPSTHLPTAVSNNMLFIAWYGAGVRAVNIPAPYRVLS